MKVKNHKIILNWLLILMIAPLFASGPYDGIWSIRNVGYFMVTEKEETIIIVRLAENTELWEAYKGNRQNKTTFQVQTFVSAVEATIQIQILSATQLKATQLSCKVIKEGYSCILPNGFPLIADKIF